MGLLVAVDRHIAAGDRDLKEGRWNKGAYSKASGLAGRTLGILGMGGVEPRRVNGRVERLQPGVAALHDSARRQRAGRPAHDFARPAASAMKKPSISA